MAVFGFLDNIEQQLSDRVESVLPQTRVLERGDGIVPMVGNKLARAAYSGGFGYIKGRYREQASVMGVPADLLVGVLATAAGAVATISGGGQSSLGHQLDMLGDAGIMSFTNSIGAYYGAKASGRQVLVLNPGTSAPAALPAGYSQPGMSVLGDIPPAVGGAYLTAEEIAHYTAQR
jgi:hypothetical protein